jgi:hypothetical protein
MFFIFFGYFRRKADRLQNGRSPVPEEPRPDAKKRRNLTADGFPVETQATILSKFYRCRSASIQGCCPLFVSIRG